MGKRGRDNSHKNERMLLADIEEDLDEVNDGIGVLIEQGVEEIAILRQILAAVTPAQQVLTSIRIRSTVV